MADVQGFYALYYAGPTGEAAMGVMIYDGRLAAIDPAGGEFTGTYKVTDSGDYDLEILLSFLKGSTLVTGQTVEADITIPIEVTLKKETLNGEVQRIELPFGPLNFKLVRKIAL